MKLLGQPPLDARLTSRADDVVVHVSPWLVERGRHEELLAHKGRYAQMWARQSAEEEDEAGEAAE